ncbi:MAG: hypothetical protein COA78_19750 [Blastopirellula sp.]|nr:MAG: hypothetical protein COA78_19750 [Blastopirellula sp.]
MPKPQKALSVRQPYLEEILRGNKTIEFRTQATNTRGPVYLYASKIRWGKQAEAELERELGYSMDELTRGAILGSVEIADCQFCEAEGMYHWQLENPQRLKRPLLTDARPQPVWFYPFGR